jgi:cyclopropane-fatty-acyl-phospholipid synthase
VHQSTDALSHSRAVMAILFGPPDRRPFDVRYWDGSTEHGGDRDAVYSLIVNRPGALRRMLLPPSEISIVEAYLSGDMDVEGNLGAAVTLGDEINARLKSARTLSALMRHLLALPRHDSSGAAGDARHVRDARAEHSVAREGRRHEKRRDRSAVQYHYDVGNDFYRLWLDERMVYSCAYFERADESLEDAQLAKLDLVCRKLMLEPGDRFLDVGCGWGALIMHAARAYGVNALGITLSQAQAELARARIAAAGLEDRCTVEIRDYRDLRGLEPFDRIASVGMVEHVGVDNLGAYFQSLYGALAPQGLLLNHGIVGVNAAPPIGWRERIGRKLWRRDEFIDQYVFPDGKLGPLHAVIAAGEASGFETRDVQSLREHYALTLDEWLRRLEMHAPEAIAATSERTYRTWRLYMTASAHGFRSGRLNVLQTLFAKPDAQGNSGLPLTRAEWLGAHETFTA